MTEHQDDTAGVRDAHATNVRALPKRSSLVPWKLPDGLQGLAVGGAELLAEDEGKPDFVVDGLLEKTDVALFTGEEKVALKTWQLLDLAVAVITGQPWQGRAVRCGKPARVLFISTETSKRNIARRLRALCRGRGVKVEDVAPFMYVVDEPITILPSEALDRARYKSRVGNAVASLKTPDKDRRAALERNIEAVADGEARRMGRNVDALEALLASPPGTWALVCIDTVRQTLEGDENSSADAARYTQGCRELARSAGCPVVASHHTNKSGTAGDARSSRGSVELTAGPDCLLTVDTSGDYPTVHYRLRNSESPAPAGYRLLVEGDVARLEVLPPCGRGNDVGEDDVLNILKAHADTGLTESTIRKMLAAAKGGKPGAKANQKLTTRTLDALVRKKLAAKCEIRQRKGPPFEGWRLGPVGGTVEAKPVQKTLDEALMEDPTDV